jgi:zinc finger protein ubi-d4
VVERKTRIPYIDNQTRVAQTNSSFFWYQSYDREPGYKQNQLYSYPVKTWVKKRRIQLEQDTNSIKQQADIQSLNENSNSMDTGSLLGVKIQQLNDHPVVVQHLQQLQPPLPPPPPQQQQNLNHQVQQHQDWHMEDESFDNMKDDDDESDYDDYEETKKKKTKKGKKGVPKKELPLDEKPHVCAHCGAKYKTKPGLTYHVSKMHSDGNANGDATPSRKF